MARRLFTNNAYGVLSSDIGPADTVLGVSGNAVANFPEPTSEDICMISIQGADDSIEIMRLLSRDGFNFTVQRGQEGTAPQSFLTSSLVELRLTANALNNFAQRDQIETVSGDWEFEQNVDIPLSPTEQQHAASKYYVDQNIAEGYSQFTYATWTGVAGQTNFALTNNGYIEVFINGAQLVENQDYTFDEDTFTLASPVENDADIVWARRWHLYSIGLADARFTRWFETAEALRANVDPTVSMTAVTLGALDSEDGGGGVWQWNPTSTEDDDLAFYLEPNGQVGPGRYQRVLNGPIILAEWYGNIAFVAPPTGHALAPNRQYLADGVGWDPAGKVGGIAYPVWYDGTNYHALY